MLLYIHQVEKVPFHKFSNYMKRYVQNYSSTRRASLTFRNFISKDSNTCTEHLESRHYRIFRILIRVSNNQEVELGTFTVCTIFQYIYARLFLFLFLFWTLVISRYTVSCISEVSNDVDFRFHYYSLKS
jgi:hypothetical protein